jgi:hypothetical protein
MHASIHADRMPLSRHLEVHSKSTATADTKSKFSAFCRSLVAVETLRQVQSARLMNYLQVDTLPRGIGDTTLWPMLTPDVRAMVQDFPDQAEKIVQQQGLGVDEFNRLLKKAETNAFFRWKVQRHVSVDAPACV